MSESFSHFVGIDWSGAKGRRQKGLAVAVAEQGVSAPLLVTPEEAGVGKGSVWSRPLLLEWLKSEFLRREDRRALIGIDAAFSLPYQDEGAFLPDLEGAGWQSAADLWAEVEAKSADEPTFYGRGFVDTYPDYFLRPGARGEKFKARFRVSEQRANDGPYKLGRMESPFHLVGPSQVGLSGFSCMRMLAQLARESGVAFWPFMPTTDAGMVLVEVFSTLFVRMGGHIGKIRDAERLNLCLAELDSNPVMQTGPIPDHAGDALVTAAGLRVFASQGCYWNPQALSDKVRRTEGWVFGIV